MVIKKFRYPETRVEDHIDNAAGIPFTDPYHWLESQSEEVEKWQSTQNNITDHYVRSWPHYRTLKNNVCRYMVAKPTVLPRYVRGHWFRMIAIQNCHNVIIADSPYGAGRVIYRLESESQNAQHSISWLSPSPDGSILAIGVCIDSSGKNLIKLIRIDTQQHLANEPPQILMDSWMGGVQWLPDSSGFYFLSMFNEATDFKQQILYHSISEGTQKKVNFPGRDPNDRDYAVIMVSRHGRYHLAYQGLLNTVPVALLDTQKQALGWQPFITQGNHSVIGCFDGNNLVAVTDIGAPHGRVVEIPLDVSARGDQKNWKELIPESTAIIRSISLVGDMLYISELINTYSRVRIFTRYGKFIREMPLPGKGGIDELFFPIIKLAASQYLEKFVFSFSTLAQSWGVYSHKPHAQDCEVLQAPNLIMNNTIIEDHFAISADGTRIPYHILRLAKTDPTIPQPTLIHAYGGFNSARPPVYPDAMAAFVASGGLYVLSNVRGGSEFGRNWWQSGRMAKMQNCYDDLYGVAEALIKDGRTGPKLLAFAGVSKGGLMAGVAATQRPDLWSVVVAQVPVLDLIGTLRHPYGRYISDIEYGDCNSTTDIKRIARYSPYHLIKDDVRYPAMFISAGATDPRCPPWHARKFAGRLQAANKSTEPVLLRVWENSGHGQATGRESLISQYAHWLAFVMKQFGIHPLGLACKLKSKQIDE